jgi:hypothetical protein
MDFCGSTSTKNVVVMTTPTTIIFTENSLKKELVFLSFVEAPIYWFKRKIRNQIFHQGKNLDMIYLGLLRWPKKGLYLHLLCHVIFHYYKSGVQFTSLNHYGTLKVK